MKKILLTAIFLLWVATAQAATYYMATAANGGSNSNNGSINSRWLTLAYSFSQMSGGDTLIIGDGTYTGTANDIFFENTGTDHPPVGTSGAYTVIKAEHDGEVVFDGEDTRRMFGYVNTGDKDNLYWQFEGILWCRTAGEPNIYIYGGAYVKFLRCGAYDAGNGLVPNVYLSHCSYMLCEGCYAYGSGRYKFEPYQSDHMIFRSCVGRTDRHNFPGASDVIGGFSIYSVDYAEIQNCIQIDSDQDDYYTGWDEISGSFLCPSTDANSTYVHFDNCIALNNSIGGLGSSGTEYTANYDTLFRNCVVWDCYCMQPVRAFNYFKGHRAKVLNCTFGSNSGSGYRWFNGMNQNLQEGTETEIKNTLVYGFTGTSDMFVSIDYQSYNNFHDNANLVGVAEDTYTTLDPIYNASTNPTGALKYITRIEDSSNLDGQGESGGDIGANVKTLIGTPGTLWGETGYATDTAVSMWPFPNEALIRTKMKAYSGGGVSGDRGFCADGETLTHYIMNYLGNGNPYEPPTVNRRSVGTVKVSGGIHW